MAQVLIKSPILWDHQTSVSTLPQLSLTCYRASVHERRASRWVKVCRGSRVLLFASVMMKRRSCASLLNGGVFLHRVPQVLVQGCHLVGEDGVEAREAGAHLEEK